MKIAYFIKKATLLQDASIGELLARLSDSGCQLYPIQDGLQPGTDMLLAFGGDGTFLSGARLVAEAGVPVLGVNLGRLGFLSENRIEDVAAPLLAGQYSVEEREMLSVRMDGAPVPDFWPYAVNEFAIARSGSGILEVDASLDGEALPPYWADGLIVATSSGSTAYSLSVGGPICTPDVNAFILAPIAPHNLNQRPLVVSGGTRVDISFKSRHSLPATVSIDNQAFPVPEGTKVTVCAAPFRLRRVVLGKSNFINALRSKLFWGEDVRNRQ